MSNQIVFSSDDLSLLYMWASIDEGEKRLIFEMIPDWCILSRENVPGLRYVNKLYRAKLYLNVPQHTIALGKYTTSLQFIEIIKRNRNVTMSITWSETCGTSWEIRKSQVLLRKDIFEPLLASGGYISQGVGTVPFPVVDGGVTLSHTSLLCILQTCKIGGPYVRWTDDNGKFQVSSEDEYSSIRVGTTLVNNSGDTFRNTDLSENEEKKGGFLYTLRALKILHDAIQPENNVHVRQSIDGKLHVTLYNRPDLSQQSVLVFELEPFVSYPEYRHVKGCE